MKSIRAGNAELHAVDRGQGPVLLFVHGFPLDHSMWSAQIEHFSRGWRVIAPDLRGFGRSTVTPGIVTMEQFADDLAALLDALGVDQPVALCGLSMGGYIAWEFWRKYASRLRALVLCDTRACGDSPDAAATRLKMVDHVLQAGTRYVAEAMLPRLFAPETFQNRPGVVEFERERILGASPAGIAAALRGLAQRADASEWLPRIRVPTLVIVGEHDAISTVAEMRSIAERMPSARLEVIPKSGHMTALEQPDAFNQVLEQFLRSSAA